MSDTIISVEGIGKKYQLNHLVSRQKEDLLVNSVKTWGRNLLRPQVESEEFWAVKDISFEVKRGDRVGIVGRNGAGKSTLLKILSRIVAPTTGRIEFEGRIASLLEVGTGFHGDLTGRENIYLNGSILGMSRSEINRRFDEIVAFSEVENFLDTPVKRFSSGMYVKLAFAVAAHLDPEILVVDEVLAVGDAAFQKKCLGKMSEVSKGEGRTILFVSHSMQSIQKLCNKGIYLNKGQLQSYGEIHDIVSMYLQSGELNRSEFVVPEPAELSYGYAHTVFVEDANGKPCAEVPVGSHWQVRVLFKITKATEHFIMGLGVISPYDEPVRTTWSIPENLAPGEYQAVFKNNDILLTSGIYKLVIGLSSHVRTFQYIDNLVSVNISDVVDLAEGSGVINTQSGLIINQMPVSMSKIN
jgi:lipopolysaccharide transport system ATP-binding protein